MADVITECKCGEIEKSIRPWNENTMPVDLAVRNHYISHGHILQPGLEEFPKTDGRSFRHNA